jgi:dethiobiotin synthetase
MKFITISSHQFDQLVELNSSFTVIFIGSWQKRQYDFLKERICSIVRTIEPIILRVVVGTNTSEEDLCIDSLRISSLPSIVVYEKGRLFQQIEVTFNGSWEQHVAAIPSHQFSFNSVFSNKFIPRSINALLKVCSDRKDSSSCVKLFVSGDRSSVGKTSTCLAILVSLIKRGVLPKNIAYIKPVTQCEAEQPISQFCKRIGVTFRDIGPVVFYKGFTRAYLNGETASAADLLEDANAAVDEISRGKLFVLVDGVGYPTVGSICNISNAHVAARLRAPVLLVGKSGVGDAVDSYNLNSTYFYSHGVRVLGGIFNKLPIEGYYSLSACKEAVTLYFQQFKPSELPYGFLPLLNITPVSISVPLAGAGAGAGAGTEAAEKGVSIDMEVDAPDGEEVKKKEARSSDGDSSCDVSFTDFEEQLSGEFLRHIDLDRLLYDCWEHQVRFFYLYARRVLY